MAEEVVHPLVIGKGSVPAVVPYDEERGSEHSNDEIPNGEPHPSIILKVGKDDITEIEGDEVEDEERDRLHKAFLEAM